MTHPDLTAALARLDAGQLGPIVRIGMRARFAAREGRRCECAEPELTGHDLLCGACLLENRDQERRAVDRLVGAHEFVPGKLSGRMCAVCTGRANLPRHHGVDEVGHCSWGERRRSGLVLAEAKG